LLELGDISLIRQQLLPSSRSEGADVESQHHRLLAAEIAETNDAAILIFEDEIRSRLTDAGWSGVGGNGHNGEGEDRSGLEKHG
jgi:hypothetical protein